MAVEVRKKTVRVIPVFDFHNYEPPSWNPGAIKKVRDLRPGVLAIDGLTPNEGYFRMVTVFSPGPPADLIEEDKQMVVFGGDLLAYSRNSIVEDLQNLKEASKTHFRELAGNTYNHPNSLNSGVLLTNFAKDFTPVVVSIVLGFLERQMLNTGWLDKAIFGMGVLDILSRGAAYANPYQKLLRPLLPLGIPLGDIDLRNSLISAKGEDAYEHFAGEYRINSSVVGVLGSVHGLGKEVWNNKDIQEKIIAKSVRRILEISGTDGKRNGQYCPSKAELIDELVQLFATGKAWVLERQDYGKAPFGNVNAITDTTVVSPFVQKILIKEVESFYPGL